MIGIALQHITDAQREAMVKKSAQSLPDVPSMQNWTPQQFKNAITKCLFDNENSFYAIINKLADDSFVFNGSYTFKDGLKFIDDASTPNTLIEFDKDTNSFTINSKLAITEDVSFSEDVTISGDLTVGGETTFYDQVYFNEEVKSDNIIPNANNTHVLGSTSYKYKTIYVVSAYTTNVYADYVIPNGSNESLGTSDNKWAHAYINSLVVGTNVASDLIPSDTNTYKLGNSGYYWNEGRINTGYINTLFGQSVAITTGLTMSNGSKVTGDLIPYTDDYYYLGSSSYKWTGAYIDTVFADYIQVDTILGKTSSSSIDVNSSLLPKGDTDGKKNLGSLSYKWKNIYGENVYATSMLSTVSLGVTTSTTIGGSMTITATMSVSGSASFSNDVTFSKNVQVSSTYGITDGTYTVKIVDLKTLVDLYGTDSDSVVNKINEVLAVFDSYPEGTTIVSALALKFDKAKIITSYSDTNVSSDDYIMSSKLVKTKIDAILDDIDDIMDGTKIVKKAYQDEDGENIKSTYAKIDDITDGTIVAKEAESATKDSEGNTIATHYYSKEDGFAIGLVEVTSYDESTGQITLSYNDEAITEIDYDGDTGVVTFTY